MDRNKKFLIFSGVAAAVLALALVLALTQPWRLWTSSSVDEAFPGAVSTSVEATTEGGVGAQSGVSASPEGAAGSPEVAAPVFEKSGQFVSVEHDTSGKALIVTLPDGSRVLRLEGLASVDGPDLKVVLTSAKGDLSGIRDANYVVVGDLKATHGNQNYVLPAGVNLDEVNSVVIWCDRFSAAFGAAELAPAQN